VNTAVKGSPERRSTWNEVTKEGGTCTYLIVSADRAPRVLRVLNSKKKGVEGGPLVKDSPKLQGPKRNEGGFTGCLSKT